MDDIKLFNAQISIFLKDGIMNPARYSKIINEQFNQIFSNENLSLDLQNFPGVPDDMPLVKYTSKSEDYAYDFARKRINFYISFKSFGGEKYLAEYLEKIAHFLKSNIIMVTDICRIGVACSYYIEGENNNISYWGKKYNLPFMRKNVCELAYTINNPFEKEELSFNNVITLTSGELKSSKVVPIVSIDINNNEVSCLSEEQLDYILTNIDSFKIESIRELLNCGK